MAAKPEMRPPHGDADSGRDIPPFPEPDRRTLESGLRVVLLDLPWTHWVQIQVAVRAGAIYESDENAGISHFLEHLRCRTFLDESGRPALVDYTLDAIGAYLEAYTSPDQTAYLVQVRPEHQAECLDVIRSMLFSPDITRESVETEKQMVESEYVSGSDDPEEVEYIARERILGEEGLGRTAIGTPERVRKFTVEDLVAFDRKVYIPSNVVIVVAGKLDSAGIGETLASWKRLGKERPGNRPKASELKRKKRQDQSPDIVFERDSRASCDLVFAYPAFGEGDPALLPASMLRHVLHQRISDRLRRAGIPVYDLWLHMHSYRREGIFYIGARVTGTLLETVQCVQGEVEKLAAEGPTEEETARTREWNRTYLVQMLDRPDEYAGRLTVEELYGTHLDPAMEWRMTDGLKCSDLREVAGRLLKPDALTFCLLGAPNFREKRQIRRILREAARNGDSRREDGQP